MALEGGIVGIDFMDKEEGVAIVDDHNRRLDDHSSALAEKLLQGWTLLNEHCQQCLTPLVRNRQKRMYCAACRQWILIEAEASARALQQRVDKSDLTEQNRNASIEQSTPPSTNIPGDAFMLPPTQTNGKSNGIAHLRLSLATLKVDEEKAQDNQNPKRFASSDLAHDGAPRLPLIDTKENGTTNGTTRQGVITTFQHEAIYPAPSQIPTKPTLFLQPSVNPVNDILVARRTLTTLNEKLELFAILGECIHAIEVTRQLLKSVE